MSMVDHAGRKPHCSSGSICCASQKSLRRLATIFSSTLPAWETSEIPRKLLQSDRSDFLWSTLIVAFFQSCGISSPLHTRTRMAWKCLRMTGSRVGSSSLSSSTGSESAPGAFQLAIARTAFCVSAYVGSASSDIGSSICDLAPGGGGCGAFLRCCTFSTMDGWSVVVVVVVSHIQRIGCQPEKTTLHGGQSRSWSAEQGKENKRKSLAAYPPAPPTPHTARSEKRNKITRRIYRRYAGGRSRVRTRIPSARRLRRLISGVMSASSVMRPPRYTNWWTWWYF